MKYGALILFLLLFASSVCADRSWEPVVLVGENFSKFSSTPLAELFLFKFDGSWQEIPLQIDERRDVEHPVLYFDYVWSGVEGNGFDANDELVFLWKDAGSKAPSGELPSGMNDEGYELLLQVDDQTKYVYLFSSSTASHISLPDYVSLSPLEGVCLPNDRGVTDCGPGAQIETSSYSATFPRRWVFESLKIKSPLGTNIDIIDKLKYRVYDLYAPFVGIGSAESEESWAVSSEFTGQKDGNIRAIRQVNDAASADNRTFVRTYLYPKYIVRDHNLIVHPLNNLWSYFDYAITPLTLYSDAGSFSLDGSPDTIPALPVYNTTQISSSHGSFINHVDIESFPQVRSENFLLDNASFDDGTGSDGKVLGGNGLRFVGLLPEQWEGRFINALVLLEANAPNQIGVFNSYFNNPISTIINNWNASTGSNCVDDDSDGFGVGADCLGSDCDDANASINPDANELCGDNTIDEDCSGEYCRNGDPTEDLKSDIFDLTLVGSTFTCQESTNTCWDAKARRADTNADNIIDIIDLNHVSAYFGVSY